MKKNTFKRISSLLAVAVISATGTFAVVQSAAAISSTGAAIIQTAASILAPTLSVTPFLNSPYVLDTAGIVKNQANNTWNIDYAVPPNTFSNNFFLQINGTSVGFGQILNGELVFRVPDASFGPLGTALVALVNKGTGLPVAMNAVLVLAQGLQPSPYVLNGASIMQNANGSWDVGYYVPPNTISTHFSLTVGNNPRLTNGVNDYGGMIFKVPASYFTSGSSLTLTLRDDTLGVIDATNRVNVPVSGPSPYVLDASSIKQETDGSWDVGYRVPPNTQGNHLSLTPGSGAPVTDGAFSSSELYFGVPQSELTAGSQATLKLTDVTTNQVWATDTVTVPAGLPVQFILDKASIVQATTGDKTWKIGWKIPPDTNGSDYSLVIGTKGEIGNGDVVNGELFFTVPAAMYTTADQSSLALKDILTGTTYNADGTVTQGTPDASAGGTVNGVGGLVVTFPTASQNITQTSATIVASIHPLIDLPLVDLSYVWLKSSDPTQNVTTQLLKVPGPTGLKAAHQTTCTDAALVAGTCKETTTTADDRQATMTFSGLTAGTTYKFVIKNNVTNTVSDPIQFTTPTTAGGKSYISYAGAYAGMNTGASYGDPTGGAGGPVADTISDTGIVPRCGLTLGPKDDPKDPKFAPCRYNDFLKLISNILHYAIIIIGPIIAVLALYYGFMIMILGRIPDRTAEQQANLNAAKAGLVKIAIGIVIILSGWVIIATITSELGVKSNYTLLDVFSGH